MGISPLEVSVRTNTSMKFSGYSGGRAIVFYGARDLLISDLLTLSNLLCITPAAHIIKQKFTPFGLKKETSCRLQVCDKKVARALAS